MSTTVNLSQVQKDHGDFVERIYKMSGQDVRRCYQCGKCSAGCSVHICKGMDVSPNRIMRMVQLNMEEEALNSKTIWACVLCSTCTARCPRDIDVARVMDALRILAKKRGITSKFKNANIFHDVFMGNIAAFGRSYELGLAIALNFKTGNLFNDMDMGLPTVMRGKMHFLPPRLKNAGEIRKIMENCKRLEGEE